MGLILAKSAGQLKFAIAAPLSALASGAEEHCCHSGQYQDGYAACGHVTTKSMTEDKFLVGPFRARAQIFDREDANVMISTEHDDFFTKNLVAIRAEERLTFAVYKSGAFVKGDLGNLPLNTGT